MPNATFSIVDQDPADEDITGPKGSSKKHSMKTDLSCVGFLWALLSFAAMGLTCVGFYMPLWLQGSMRNGTPTSLGLFRRCNYLRMNPDNKIELIMECGRYTTFHDIPSLWWQIATVMVAVGAGLLVVVAFGAMLSCCVLYVVSRTTSKFGGSVQFLAGLCIAVGCVMYPLGWENTEVKQVCGSEADLFELGHCQISWAYYTAVAGGALAFICALLSCHAAKHRGGYQRTSTRA